ncbi:MAG: hypothetical protein Q8Q39_05245 [bacterium]|nr:hypothetical protein [bacterium]
MLNLVFGLHLYQPPTQTSGVIKQIAAESYRPLLKVIHDHPRAYVCVDIAASALELLEVHAPDVIDLMHECLERKKLFLVNTAAFHPILPLLRRSEIERQLCLNIGAYEQRFKPFVVPRGCFLPEMAYSSQVIQPLRRSWARWTMTDDDPYQALHNQKPPFNWIAGDQGFSVFLRSNLWSNRISLFNKPENRKYADGRVFANELCAGVREWQGPNADGYVVVWLDFETFGHHSHKDFPNLIHTFFPPLFDAQSDALRLTDPDALKVCYPTKETVIPAGSWSTTPQQWLAGNYFPMWDDKNVQYHAPWWKMVNLALDIAQRHARDPRIRRLGDKMVYSCQPWQYVQGNKHLARLGLPYFEQVLPSGTQNEQDEGRRLLDALYELTRE